MLEPCILSSLRGINIYPYWSTPQTAGLDKDVLRLDLPTLEKHWSSPGGGICALDVLGWGDGAFVPPELGEQLGERWRTRGYLGGCRYLGYNTRRLDCAVANLGVALVRYSPANPVPLSVMFMVRCSSLSALAVASPHEVLLHSGVVAQFRYETYILDMLNYNADEAW